LGHALFYAGSIKFRRTIGFDHNADGQRTEVTRPNGVTTDYGYDLAGRLTSVVHGGGGLGSNDSFSYTLDDAGNRTAVTGSRGTETYTLDALNRLTNVTYANSDTAAYTYDANGNRLSHTVNGVQTHTYTYDDADQLTSDGTLSYTYDQSGNLLTAGTDAYTWDWKNRLDSATVSSTTASYTYDGDDVRISETVGATTTTSIWDRASGLPLLVDDGTDAYLHAGGIQGEVDGSNAASYHLTDALGSVRGMTNGSGSMTGSSDYGVFGSTRASSGASSVLGFTGEQQDSSTGLTYLRARSYSATTGRFLSADTVQPNAPGTQGYNRYAYTANNPTTWTDPSGHSVGDALMLKGELSALLDRFTAVSDVVQPLAGFLLGLGPLGAGLGLAVAFVWMILVMVLIRIVMLMVSIALERWDFFDEDNPRRKESKSADELTATPDCGLPDIPLPWPQSSAFQELARNIVSSLGHSWKGWMWEKAFRLEANGAYMAFVFPDLAWMIYMVRPGGPWDYKHPGGASTANLEDFGNWHYGVITAAMGMTLPISQCGAGIVQLGQRALDEIFQRGGRPIGLPCGDPGPDAYWIGEGWDWFCRCILN
jgi:RHS repeat-associated protein